MSIENLRISRQLTITIRKIEGLLLASNVRLSRLPVPMPTDKKSAAFINYRATKRTIAKHEKDLVKLYYEALLENKERSLKPYY